MTHDDSSYRALSIQSHMVSGYCGNKAAVFPLQTLGFDVDILNTVQFSNHTGYPSWTGGRLTANEVQELFTGLERNGLTDDYTHVLTGYIGNYEILERIEAFVCHLKTKSPKLIFVCDPVMGDGGRLYVAPEIVPLYRDILRTADIVTPNQFEAETLAETTINSLESASEAAKALHALGTPNVIITSVSLPVSQVPESVRLPSGETHALYCLTSHKSITGVTDQHLIAFPTYPGYFTGTGDMFSGLVVARWQEAIDNKAEFPLASAAFKVVSTVNAITLKTFNRQKAFIKSESRGQTGSIEKRPDSPTVIRQCELMVIKGKKEIEDPDSYSSAIKMAII
ncbi:Ribokinase-like protein [Phycomyces nitens]|nr:Ribokinase-like protein [Phycomyces nitens]